VTRLIIEWDYDPDDRRALRLDLDTAKDGRFFVAWLNPATNLVEWTSTDELHDEPDFEDLVDVMARNEDHDA
jgi:hypothetical protein